MIARENPFEADRIERLLTFDPSWLGLSWEEILDRAGKLGFRGAVIGPHGSGKSSFCDAFAPRLEAAGFEVVRWFLNDEKPGPDPVESQALEETGAPGRTILLIDGAEFLKLRLWRRLARDSESLGGIIITAHRESRFPVLLRTETRPEMLQEFVNQLAPGFEWEEEALRCLFDSCSGNLREALWACYDRVAAK